MKSVNNFVIVGGGTAGWMTAAAILHEIPHINITLIDKEKDDAIGVGESTLLGFEPFLSQTCGFNPKEYLPAIDATLKSGILFPDWGYDGNVVWHPFYFLWLYNKIHAPLLCDGWSHFQDEFDFVKFMALYEPSMNNQVDTKQISHSYSYNIDCKKLVQYIRSQIEDKINFISSSVLEKNDNTLKLANGQEVVGDIFFDCSGFKSLLKKKQNRVDLSDRLFCNTAIPSHVEYQNKEHELIPYTFAHCVDHGWIWRIGLQSRIGTGLVFNRNITDPEDAKDYFVKYWDNRIDRDSLRVIDWTPYYDRTPWDDNVISIGLSGGFIEPLEAVGIALLIESITTAINKLQPRWYNEHDVQSYNLNMVQWFEGCTDFLSMHYDLSTKQTKFWEYVRSNYKRSAIQDFYVKNLDSQQPSIVPGKGDIFGGVNWTHWLVSLGYKMQPKGYVDRDDLYDIVKKEWDNHCTDNYTDHATCLEHMNGTQRLA